MSLLPRFLCRQTIQSMKYLKLANIPTTLYPYVVVTLNGTSVNQDQWHFIEPREEDIIGIHVIPMGGDGAKGLLRMVALIAVAIAAPYIAGAIPGLTAVGGRPNASGDRRSSGNHIGGVSCY